MSKVISVVLQLDYCNLIDSDIVKVIQPIRPILNEIDFQLKGNCNPEIESILLTDYEGKLRGYQFSTDDIIIEISNVRLSIYFNTRDKEDKDIRKELFNLFQLFYLELLNIPYTNFIEVGLLFKVIGIEGNELPGKLLNIQIKEELNGELIDGGSEISLSFPDHGFSLSCLTSYHNQDKVSTTQFLCCSLNIKRHTLNSTVMNMIKQISKTSETLFNTDIF